MPKPSVNTDPVASEALFPIGTLSSRTGVKTVTLRAWERRYGLLKPKRTPKGHRLFSMRDVERVHQVLNLLEQGIPVNRVRKILDSESVLPELVSVTSDSRAMDEDPWGHFLSRFSALVEALDSRSLDRAFSEVTSLYSLELVASKLILPMYDTLQKKARLLPSLAAEQAFFHEFLMSRLGASYLHNNQNLPRGHKRVLFVAGENPKAAIRALLLANSCHIHAIEANYLGNIAGLDALPIVLQRTRMDGLVFVDDAVELDTLLILVNEKSPRIFIDPMKSASANQHSKPGSSRIAAVNPEASESENSVERAENAESSEGKTTIVMLEQDIARAVMKILQTLDENQSPAVEPV